MAGTNNAELAGQGAPRDQLVLTPATERGITGYAAEKAQVTGNHDGIVADYAVEQGNPADSP